jgi:hypothetical protein
VAGKTPECEKQPKMKVEADELLKTNEIENDRMPEADEFMKIKDLSVISAQNPSFPCKHLKSKAMSSESQARCDFDLRQSTQKYKF